MPQLSNMTEVERDAYLRERAVREAMEQPGRSAWLAVKKLGRTWSPIPLSRSESAAAWVVGLGYYVPLWLLTFVGLRYWPGSLRQKLVLLTPILTLTVLHMLSVGSMRYRLPGEPLMAVLAAAGAMQLWQRRVNLPKATEAADLEIEQTNRAQPT